MSFETLWIFRYSRKIQITKVRFQLLPIIPQKNTIFFVPEVLDYTQKKKWSSDCFFTVYFICSFASCLLSQKIAFERKKCSDDVCKSAKYNKKLCYLYHYYFCCRQKSIAAMYPSALLCPFIYLHWKKNHLLKTDKELSIFLVLFWFWFLW